MEEANPASDRYFDLSLRVLTIFVLVSLVCCVAFLIYRWVTSNSPNEPAAAVHPPNPVVKSQAPAADTAPAPADQVLVDPRKAFQCNQRGKAPAFSDRPCDTGSEQKLVPLNPAQPAAASH